MGKGWIIGVVVGFLVVAAALYARPWLLFPIIFVGIFAGAGLMAWRQAKARSARNESLFVSMFPELQPWYHPKKLFDYALARLAQSVPRGGKAWKDPPGFAGQTADIRFEDEREIVRILDAPGTLLTQFIFEPHPEGAAIRVGKGKFTLATGDPKLPRVRYWHPDREFKWTPSTWQFKTPMAERAFESSDRGSSFSSDSPSSSFSSSRGISSPFAAGGGTFDGGGASQSWSEGGAGGAADTAGTASTSY